MHGAEGQHASQPPEEEHTGHARRSAVAFVEYRREDDHIALLHTEVPEALSGRGVGSKLVRGVLDALRAERAKVVPRCEFVAAYIERHPEYRDLLADEG